MPLSPSRFSCRGRAAVAAAVCCAALLPAAGAWATPVPTSVPAPGPAPAAAETAALPAPYARWQSSMDAFAAADQAGLPQAGGVLFVGSSTIRLWTDLREDFRQLPVVINRGFGGSTMADCNYFVKRLVLQYRPRQVIVYAGDNDLAEGRSPAQVLESLRSFAGTVRTELPDTRISYVSIKPSPLRSALLPRIREANALIADYLSGVPGTDYIDIFSPMMAADGQPRAELFGPDRLHMNAAGYDLWQSAIRPYLQEVQAPMPQMRADAVPAPASPVVAGQGLVAGSRP